MKTNKIYVVLALENADQIQMVVLHLEVMHRPVTKGLRIGIRVRMKKKWFSAEQTIGKLKEAEVILSQGST